MWFIDTHVGGAALVSFPGLHQLEREIWSFVLPGRQRVDIPGTAPNEILIFTQRLEVGKAKE